MDKLTVSLDVAKQLKKAGWPMTVLFAPTFLWRSPLMNEPFIELRADSRVNDFPNSYYPAPTASEIAEVLQTTGRFEIKSSAHQKRIDAWFWVTDMSGRMFHGHGDTMADALAHLWLKLETTK